MPYSEDTELWESHDWSWTLTFPWTADEWRMTVGSCWEDIARAEASFGELAVVAAADTPLRQSLFDSLDE